MSAAALLVGITQRRSARTFADEAPTAAQLAAVLEAAATVPDHGGLRPYRFVVVAGEARARFGEALATAAERAATDAGDGRVDRERYVRKAFVAPTLVAVVASPRAHDKVQAWEQRATAACAGYALALAAHGVGLGAVWKSVPFTRGDALTELLRLGDEEELLGWINLGRVESLPPPRPPVELSDFVDVLGADRTLTCYDSSTPVMRI
jgi:nitroreductase